MLARMLHRVSATIAASMLLLLPAPRVAEA
jgi:hypothetical protein